MDNKENGFSYTYSAKEQAEVERIRSKYTPREEDKMAQLRQLDRIPYKRAQGRSLTLGILGSLILGTGMSLAMTELGAALGGMGMLVGIGVGVIGLVLVALAYPVYERVLKKERERIAPQILQLTDELLK